MAIPVYHHLIGSCWAQVLALFFVVFWEENYGRTNEKDWSGCMWNDIWTGRMWKQFAGKFWWKSEQLFGITCELSTLRFQHATAYELCISSRNKAKQKRLSRQMILCYYCRALVQYSFFWSLVRQNSSAFVLCQAITSDRRIFLTGAVNSLFEGSMCAGQQEGVTMMLALFEQCSVSWLGLFVLLV